MTSILSRTGLTSLCAVALSGCAGVSFYSDPELKNRTGIPIYAPKPYLLVSRTGAEAKPVEVSIVYVNDVSNVVYAKPHSGFGSAKLTLALANGQMTSFGQDTDTKIPELLNAVSGMVTARAGAEKTEAEARKIIAELAGGTEQAAVSMEATGKEVRKVADDIKEHLNQGKLSVLTKVERERIENAQTVLDTAATTLVSPDKVPAQPAALGAVKEQAKALSEIASGSNSGDGRASALSLIKTWSSQLQSMFAKAQPEKAPQDTFELYEIVQGPGGVTLNRVK